MRKYSFDFEVIIIFIYKENFFYDFILRNSLEDINKVIENKHDCYYTVKIPKKGGFRVLNCIKNETLLYQLQTSLKHNFLNKIPIAENVYGFVKEQSYRDFLTPHVWENNQPRFYLRVDIRDFFGSINSNTIGEVLKYYFKTDDKSSREMIKLLTELISLDGVLPQGAVTSPVVSNIIFRQLDLRIQKYCKKLDFIYTRYADDLLFSSTNKRLHDPFFIKIISAILNSQSFKINTSKIKSTDLEISLNGFVVGKNLRISRSKKRDINRVLFIYEDQKPENVQDFLNLLNSNKFKSRYNVNNQYFLNKTNLLNYLSGYRSFLISWLPENRSSPEFIKNKKYIKRLESLITITNNMK
ncbi:reverse transcriptase family protein [Cytobacillus firmus]|uniref:RNA-directed DNA polymerase n=1 Tax=Cytobacillus firmus TaxID=1399 RepID=A0AA46P1Y6_CYTFI|nr:reverse transcriptase family protein [Cytobacillus firmus]UYG95327.1 reverse transcriptase family protein [Cytobacillus firmus]